MDNQPITSDNHLSIRMVWPWVQLYSLLTFPTPSEAKGPRTGLLTPINSSKASFSTYFWMLHMMRKLKGWVDLKDPKANHSWPNLARDSPIAATWATKQCPALLQCQNRMGFPTLGRPESCTAQLPFNESLCATSAAKNHNKTCTNGYALMSQWRPKHLQHLVSSHIPLLSISVQFLFASSPVAQSASVNGGIEIHRTWSTGKSSESTPRCFQLNFRFCHQKFQSCLACMTSRVSTLRCLSELARSLEHGPGGHRFFDNPKLL